VRGGIGVAFALVVAGLAGLAVWSPGIALPAAGVIAGVMLLVLVVLNSLGGSGAPGLEPARAGDDEEVDAASEEPRSATGKLVALALVFRFAVVVAVNYSDLWRSFAPDAHAWEAWGKVLSQNWGAFFSGTYEGYLNPHVLVNGVVSSVLGDSRVAVSFFNTVFGVSLAFVVRALARELWDARVAHRAFVFMLFFPSLMLWQSQNLKDVWAEVATVGLALAVVRFGTAGRSRAGALLLGGLCIGVATWTRPYLSVILVAAILMSLASAKASRLPSAALLAVLAVFGGKLAGLDETFSEETLQTIDQARKGLAYGGSAYGKDVDTTTLSGAISYFPEGMARFLFAPFPWEIDSWLQVMAFPESLFILFLSIQAFRQVLADRANLRRLLVPLAFFFCIAGSYALASGNEGTAFRHRAQVVAFIVLLASAHQVRRQRLRGRAPPEPAGRTLVGERARAA